MAIIFDEVVGTVEPPAMAPREAAKPAEKSPSEQPVDPDEIAAVSARLERRAARLAADGW